jgi:murein DD-endopeptidase MepM/ murein hydrolase activator NlpD
MKMRQRKRLRAAAGLLANLCLLAVAQRVVAAEFACADGLELRLSSPESVQGGLLLVEVRSARALNGLKAAWVGQQLRFWPAGSAEDGQRALVGVDLEQEAGTFPLTVSAVHDDGQRLACSALVSVREGKFALEELKVSRRFVELSRKDRERAERETQRLLALFARATPERLWTGGFRLPLEGAEASGNFGRRRVLNNQPRSPHSGEDFPAPAGTPVRAAQRGRVALADSLFFAGNTVVLDHGLGLYTFYGHLESLAVKEGELVDAGVLLGRVGATGRVTGAHLHWAARLNQMRVNPLALPEVLGD